MAADVRLEAALGRALAEGQPGCPPKLTEAMQAAVLGGGARLRPQLCLAVGGRAPAVLTAAVALELLHCASLVHDDLPCFDDASMRRGQPSIQARFGEAMAVLVGDALTMAAFAQVAQITHPKAPKVAQHIAYAAQRMVWGQALESEPDADLNQYHGHKTAALFEAAAVCGALLAPHPEGLTIPWRAFGGAVGSLYQMADDILDVALMDNVSLQHKSAGRDAALGRPNAALRLGLMPARAALEVRLHKARAAIVPGPQHAEVEAWFDALLSRLADVPGLWDMPQVRSGEPKAKRPNSASLQLAQQV